MNKTRLEAFSDGVFAIIITIMVLEIKSPHGTEWRELARDYPVFLSYALSFINVAIYWGNHHHLLHTVNRIDGVAIWLNMNLLFWLSLVPVSTAWMGENHFAPNTLALYAALLLVCGVAFTAMQLYITRFSSNPEKFRDPLNRMRRKGLFTFCCYGSAIPLAYFSTPLSGGLIVCCALLWLLPDRHLEKALES